jgi:hypothetical protein
VDNLFGEPAILKYIQEEMGLRDIANSVVIVSPDAGGAKRCGTQLLNVPPVFFVCVCVCVENASCVDTRDSRLIGW